MLLIITITNSEQFISKDMVVIYIGIFVKLYNWRNCSQVQEIYRMIEYKKICALIKKNPRNLGTHQMIEISLVLHSAHIVPRYEDKFVFYINDYIDEDQFNHLYNSNQIKKVIKNADKVTCKLGPVLIRAINYILEVVREEKYKRKEMMEKQITEAIIVKLQRAKRGIGLSNEEKKNYESDSKDKTDPDQTDDKYLL